LSRRRPDAIFRVVLTDRLKQFIALLVCAALVAAGFPPRPARATASASPGNEYLLRDALPAVAHASEPPDSSEDEFFLPKEEDNKKLIRDITVFVIVSAFVAFFIIKVFIEKDEDPPPPDNNGKPLPPY
jgi:hypothetical protein